MSSSTAVSAGAPGSDGPAASPLAGWSVQGAARDAYAAEVDPAAPREGHPTIRFHPTRDPEGAYGTFMTSIDAAPVRGRRAHAIVWVRTQGVTSRGDVWLRAQGFDSPPDGPGLGYSSARLQPNGTSRSTISSSTCRPTPPTFSSASASAGRGCSGSTACVSRRCRRRTHRRHARRSAIAHAYTSAYLRAATSQPNDFCIARRCIARKCSG